MNIKTPKNWRKGQTIFNFLWWLQAKKGYSPEMGTPGMMADTFHIPDDLFDKFFDEYLLENGVE